MKDKILKLQEHRPHFVVSLIDNNILVVPALYIEDIIKGKQKLKITKDNEVLIRSIISQWYISVKNEENN